jgi:hypothetical protein
LRLLGVDQILMNREVIMEKSPENKEAPNPSEKAPKREVSEEAARRLGRTAIKGK